MNCEHCDCNLKVQSTKYLNGYIKSLHILFSKKGVCEDLTNNIINFLVNGKGHRIDYVIKSSEPMFGESEDSDGEMYGYYNNLNYTVCSPCFQIGFENFKNERGEPPSLRRHAYFAMDLNLGEIKKKEYEEKSRLYLLYRIVHNYKVGYYRSKEYTQFGENIKRIEYFKI